MPRHDGGLKRDRFDLAIQHCVDLGLEVEWADLGDKRRGQCHARNGVVTLNLRLTMAQAASTLAHEVGHFVFGDARSTPRIEKRAWEYGASLLIEPREYAEAERLVGHHVSALAIDLGVTPRLIEAWRTWWSRTGNSASEFGYLDGCHLP